jgi:hypothetical protein
MDIKIVYDPQKGMAVFYKELSSMIDNLELQDRLVTVYVPNWYKKGEDIFFIHNLNSNWYQRVVEYERK